jgi:hypothetical protein
MSFQTIARKSSRAEEVLENFLEHTANLSMEQCVAIETVKTMLQQVNEEYEKGTDYFNNFVQSYKQLENQDKNKFLVENFTASIPI